MIVMLNNRDNIVVIDCQLAGISGDMLLGALIDLGADIKKTVNAIQSIKDYLRGCNQLEVSVHDVTRCGFSAKKVTVTIKETLKQRTGGELKTALLNCLKNLKLSHEAYSFAVSSLETLIEAESKIHGENLEKVHLHEIGSADTLADIIGAATALEDLGFLKKARIYSTPAAVGGGLFNFSHGIVPSPAPATLEILRMNNFPFSGGSINTELTTPTGAALLVNMVDEVVQFYPPMRPVSTGYGAGAKDFKEFPNVVRILLGERYGQTFLLDKIYVLETNLDDVSGEIIGYTINRLLEKGAKDVSVVPTITKKNRPGHILRVIVSKEDVEPLARILMEETGTLGVRVVPYNRFVLSRQIVHIEVNVDGIREKVAVKITRDQDGKIIQIKPEYEDAKRIASKTNKSLRKILNLIKCETTKVLSEGENK